VPSAGPTVLLCVPRSPGPCSLPVPALPVSPLPERTVIPCSPHPFLPPSLMPPFNISVPQADVPQFAPVCTIPLSPAGKPHLFPKPQTSGHLVCPRPCSSGPLVCWSFLCTYNSTGNVQPFNLQYRLDNKNKQRNRKDMKKGDEQTESLLICVSSKQYAQRIMSMVYCSFQFRATFNG